MNANALQNFTCLKKVSKGGDEFSALFAGDIGFGEHYLHHPRSKPLQALLAENGHEASFANLTHLIKDATISIGNLEAPLSSRPNAALVGRKNGLAWSDPQPALQALKAANFTALSLANDHTLDCGRPGLRNTQALLRKAGLYAFGAGENAGLAAMPFMAAFRSNGKDRTMVVFGGFEYRERYERRYRWYTNYGLPGVNPLSPVSLKTSIDTFRQVLPSPVFVVFPHWGESYQPVSQAQRAAAQQLILAGADAVIGHGSHIVQPLEFIDGRPVLYGLGNCIWNTPGRYGVDGQLPYGLLTTLVFPEDGEPALRLFPILTDNMITYFQNRPVTDAEFEEFRAATPGEYAVGRHLGAWYLEVPFQVDLPRIASRPKLVRAIGDLQRAN